MPARDHISQKQASEYVKDAEANIGTSTLALKKDTAKSNSFIIKNKELRGENVVNPLSKETAGQTYGGAVGADA